MSEQELKAALEAAVSGLCVTDSDRPYPVQVRGTIDGHRFYFRARDGWAFAVSDRKQDNPSGVLYAGLPGWKHEEPNGGGDDAGNMSDADVITCISGAVGFWRAHRAHGGIGELPAKPHASRMSAEERALVYAKDKRIAELEQERDEAHAWLDAIGADRTTRDASGNVVDWGIHDRAHIAADIYALTNRDVARLIADLDAAKARAAEAERLIEAFDSGTTAPLRARIAELEAKLNAARKPSTREEPTGAGDIDIVCVGCGEIVNEPHTWEECTSGLREARLRELNGRMDALIRLEKFDPDPLLSASTDNGSAACSCPAASEYDNPCELHGVRGIGSTGR